MKRNQRSAKLPRIVSSTRAGSRNAWSDADLAHHGFEDRPRVQASRPIAARKEAFQAPIERIWRREF
jgi:hypothetical protein